MAKKKGSYRCKTDMFLCEGEQQFVSVEDGPHMSDVVRRRLWKSAAVVDEIVCPWTDLGCAIQEIGASPSGTWLVTQRFSGQGEWGYDVIRSCPLAREGGIEEERHGYILDLPIFSEDETRLVGGFGENWIGGWWSCEEDDFERPARGGLITFGFLFVHKLPGHKVKRHKLQMNLPIGWLPEEDPESELWFGARAITPFGDGVRLTLPGGAKIEIAGPLPTKILLPTPDPSGGRLLPTAKGVKRKQPRTK